ncbi:MAG: 2-keto-4-pentenoate hydratase [Hyphomicrobiales bacterium]|nr:MAG: 2-keto-4-pentenoate hydratase [Hyphomicrobiales bacterium]
MKLGSLKSGGRDGTLVVVSRDLTRMVTASDIAPSLREAVENWAIARPLLQVVSDRLNNGDEAGQAYDAALLASPLPRTFQWADGSAYLSHMRLVRQARGAEMPESFKTDPLMYQGAGDTFLAPQDDIALYDESWGLDFESEISVIVDDTPAGTDSVTAKDKILLIALCNDISLRNLIPNELAKGFGFFQSKPSSAFSPVCVTPDELGDVWDGGKVNLPLVTTYNGTEFGRVEAGNDLYFDFPHLISHVAKTRAIGAGAIIGSGTVSNEDYKTLGSSCLAEKRMIEILETGSPITPFMSDGDTIKIEMFDGSGQSIFGAIDQKVVAK